jgi:uncharacterized protein
MPQHRPMKTLVEFYQTMGWALSLLVMMTFLLAGTVKGVIGLGLPTVAMGMLGLAIAPAQAAALLIIPSIVTNAWQLAAGGELRALVKRLWPMQLGIFIGTALGMLWLSIDGGSWVVRALGAALLLYALSGLFLPTLRVAPQREPWLGPVCGVITGVIYLGHRRVCDPRSALSASVGPEQKPVGAGLGIVLQRLHIGPCRRALLARQPGRR